MNTMMNTMMNIPTEYLRKVTEWILFILGHNTDALAGSIAEGAFA